MATKSLNRLKILIKRQGVDKYGADYEPGIRATKAEAPSKSRPAILRSAVVGREVHLLSEPELWAALLALYNDRLFDLNEQRMLSTEPRPHPLAAHPRARALALPHLRGTVKVAEELGCLNRHPTVRWKTSDNSSTLPYPFVGDLLLFLIDDIGPYCVNWTVKYSQNEFDFPKERMRLSKSPQKTAADAQTRLAIEVAYYRDAAIPTVRVSGDQIDATVAANLTRAFGWNKWVVQLNQKQYRNLADRLNDALYLKIPPVEIFATEMQRHGYRRDDCIAVLNQSVWRRKLRVALDKHIMYDYPLKPETVDVLTNYASWFAREQ